ncbi:putative ATPase [Actinoplanes teichomyceticus]|uniref:Putative ATPase n=2 Tax=Actinoplanes teichomyceticus TaxID=1867 RepID=A0A561WMI7_ACTTI|nr:putative ATPase [Actinoplanes teichomyceticus]
MEQLAEASGVSARAISDMERGRSVAPQRRTVQALAGALALSEADRSTFLAGRTRAAPARPASRCALPRPIADFTGRGGELDRLGRVAALARPAPAAAPVATVSGVAGVGKTALAVQAAHALGERFPGGTFFLDLRGMHARPTGPGEALARLLAALGVPEGETPVHDADRAGLYRDLLRGRPALVVLDNAADEAQVRPMLPGPGPSLTIVTSRRLLAGLDGVHRLSLGHLSAEDAAALLRSIVGVGPQRQADAVREVVELCGRLPLALRIAGNRLTSRPQWSVRHLADRLADERRRLDQLTAGDLRLAAAFNLSYDQLSPSARCLFRRLSLLPWPEFDARLAAVFGPAGPDDTEDALEELVELSLLQAETNGRYRLHNLIRLFARQRLAEEEPAAAHDTAQRRPAAARDTAQRRPAGRLPRRRALAG